MNNTTISDVEALASKSPVNDLNVTVKKAFAPEEGEGQYGAWRMQAAILKDDTGEIRATFWDRFNVDLRNLEGENLTIVSGRDGKDRFSGIEKIDYKGKPQIKISKHATLNTDLGSVTEAPQAEALTTDTQTTVTKRFVSEETKRESIEKQVALKAAVEFGVGSGINESAVMELAGKFYEFLHGEDSVL